MLSRKENWQNCYNASVQYQWVFYIRSLSLWTYLCGDGTLIFWRFFSHVYRPYNHHMTFLCALASLARYLKSLLIAHPSFYYSSSTTLNSKVLNGCVPEKVTKSILLRFPHILEIGILQFTPLTECNAPVVHHIGLKVPLGSEPRWLISSNIT